MRKNITQVECYIYHKKEYYIIKNSKKEPKN